MPDNKDYFETYLECFPDAPSLVLVRSVELKNFPKEFINPPVLDVCCGDGFFSKCLGLSGIQGVDIDSPSCERARALKATYEDVKVGDARDLSIFPPGYYQTVISNCALEHIEGVEDALSSIAKVLKPGGYLIMSVPSDKFDDWFIPKIMIQRLGLSSEGEKLLARYHRRQAHINIYSLEAWEGKLEKTGFKKEQHFYLLDEKACKLVTLLDYIPHSIFNILYRCFCKLMPLTLKRLLGRKFLKPLYLNSRPLDFGGELIIVAKKE